MRTWLEAAVYCEETFGSYVNMSEGFFVCPECGEMIYEEDWDDHYNWDECPVCGVDFWEVD